ncbi:alcohol dehydrogenase GroES-like domain protein [Mycobacterium xenopi 3993]|nr:alcohol dehydrogenase GroES-like domain protein [Mycobacterium xenopi 3993]
MQTQAAVLWERNTTWSIETIDLDPPKPPEVLVELHASGMCHSDEHIVTGDMPFRLPCIGGHEGAGVVRAVGEHVSWLQPGDHVVFSFMPSCGRCPSCSTGHQSLCDLGAKIYSGMQIYDETARHHVKGIDLALACGIGSFAYHTVVHEASCVMIAKHYRLDLACLLGCGFVTGWAPRCTRPRCARRHRCRRRRRWHRRGRSAGRPTGRCPHDHRHRPVGTQARRGAQDGRHTYRRRLDRSQRCCRRGDLESRADKFICAMGVGDGQLVAQALAMTAKRGRLVITNIHPMLERDIRANLMDLTLSEKQIVGTLYGSGNPRADIPKILELYSAGQVDLESMVTRTYPLEKVNDGYADMRAGTNIRGVLVYPGPNSSLSGLLWRSTVGENCLPGEESASVGQQECDQRPDLIGLPRATQGRVEAEIVDERTLQCLVVRVALTLRDVSPDHVQGFGFHRPWCNTVGPDPIMAVCTGDTAGERSDGGLEAGVGQPRFVRSARRIGRSRHDRAFGPGQVR